MTDASALPARLWRDYPRETLALAILAVAGSAALAGAAWSTPSLGGLDSGSEAAALPAPPPLLVRKLAPQDALSLNGAIAFASGPNPAARPFTLGKLDSATRARALECLTSAIYYEAGMESADGQRAVAQVVLNRVRHPAFPATVCGTVYQGSTRATGCQFTFTCDGSLGRAPVPALWNRARAVAEAALAGYVHSPVGWATHYHADYVVPYWAPTLAKNAQIGAHIFYRWSGGWGRAPAFTQRYSRGEPNVAALRAAAMLAERQQGELTGSEEAQALAEIPGAEALPLTPSMRRDKQVAVRFNLAARQASDKAAPTDYLEKNSASQALRWSLTGGLVEEQERPLGKTGAEALSTTGKTGAGAPAASTL